MLQIEPSLLRIPINVLTNWLFTQRSQRVEFRTTEINIHLVAGWNNKPFYCCVLSDLAYEWLRGWRWPCFDTFCSVSQVVLMRTSCIYMTKAVRSVTK